VTKPKLITTTDLFFLMTTTPDANNKMNTQTPSSQHVMNTYGRLPVSFTHGSGLQMWDTQGKRYLDGLAGIAVNTLGHAHPKLVPALQDQIAKMIHCCNYYHVAEQELLAQKLTELSGLTNAFFAQLD
jgi:acetylornithine aminotransferase